MHILLLLSMYPQILLQYLAYPARQDYSTEGMDLAQASQRGREGQLGSQLSARPTAVTLLPTIFLLVSAQLHPLFPS